MAAFARLSCRDLTQVDWADADVVRHTGPIADLEYPASWSTLSTAEYPAGWSTLSTAAYLKLGLQVYCANLLFSAPLMDALALCALKCAVASSY